MRAYHYRIDTVKFKSSPVPSGDDAVVKSEIYCVIMFGHEGSKTRMLTKSPALTHLLVGN